MDYEKKYNEALKRVRRLHDRMLVLSSTDALVASAELEFIFPELAESDDERIRMELVALFKGMQDSDWHEKYWHDLEIDRILAYLERQKENPKFADSIPSDCTSDAKCEDRWHKVSDSLPDNGRLVLANDCLGNTLLARYDGEGNWEVSVYDNEDYYCRNTITKWCEIPSEKQKEQKPVDYEHEMWKNCEANFEGGKKEVIEHPEKYGLQKPAEWSEEDETRLTNILIMLKEYVIHHYSKDDVDKSVDWLENRFKSLRPSWKPSEEQQSGSSALKAEGTNE